MSEREGILYAKTRRAMKPSAAAFALGLAILVTTAADCDDAAAAGPARNQIAQGQELFLSQWVPGDSRSHGGDGLGPLYNESSCVACHNLGGPGGAGGTGKNVDIVTLLVDRRESMDVDQLGDYHPGFRTSPSILFHRFGTDPEYNLWRLRRTGGVELADMAKQGGAAQLGQVRESMRLRPGPGALEDFTNSQKPTRGADRAKGEVFLASVATLNQRNTPPLFGAGLIDAIPVQALRDAASRSGGEVRGRLSTIVVRDQNGSVKEESVGRFGWKAQTASLKDFVESACANELGLEVPTRHQAKPPLGDSRKAPGLDLTQDECDALTAYVASLPAPIERIAPAGKGEQPDVSAGRGLFARAGCTACHLPRLGPVEGIYSDLLLHRMGNDLADPGRYENDSVESSVTADALSDEWRTPPLWGYRDSGPYLHDGRAETLEETVALHGGQGEESARNFFKLKPRERLQVQTFLNSLAAPPAEPLPR
jgi:CxxC motif-containing protein (DUF1111 family)